MKKLNMLVGMMLMATFFVVILTFSQSANAATVGVPGDYATIRHAISNAAPGDLIVIQDGYYVENVALNKSVTLRSANGSALTWINGSVNMSSKNDTCLGSFTDSSHGFTINNASSTTAGWNTIEIGMNESQHNITVRGNIIIKGYSGIRIGRNTTYNRDITIYSNTIHGQGASAINCTTGMLNASDISLNTIYNCSYTAPAAMLLFDGGHDVLIYYNVVYNSNQNGEGINITGAEHSADNFRMISNTIYNVGGYSPIIVRSLTTRTAANMRMVFNELENNSNDYSEAAIRFDNVSGQITATNISIMYNNIDTTGYDIEERIITAYKNWTGVMKAYFNWYGINTGGTFRYSAHQNATPYMLLSSAVGNVNSGADYVEITGASTGSINATQYSDVNLTLITTTDDVVVVIYPYGLGQTSCPYSVYPQRAMHNYKEVGVSNTNRITFPVNITVFYDTADLAIRGWGESHIHGLAFYNESSAAWESFNDTGKNTTYSDGGYSGFVWGVAYTSAQLTGAVLSINFNEITEGASGVTPVADEDEEAVTVPPLAVWVFLGLGVYVWVTIAIVAFVVIVFIGFAATHPKWRKKNFGF